MEAKLLVWTSDGEGCALVTGLGISMSVQDLLVR